MMDELGRTLAEETDVQRRLFEELHRRQPTYATYARHCLCLTSATIVRREVFDRIGGYDDSAALVGLSVTGEDLDLYLRIALDYELDFLGGAPLMRYRVHAAQTSLEELTLGEIAVCRKHLGLLAEHPGSHVAEALALTLRMLDCYHRLADGPQARRAARHALALDPRLAFSPSFLKRAGLAYVPGRALRRARSLKRSVAGARR